MRCESCRAGDPICNAWIACEGQVSSDYSPDEVESESTSSPLDSESNHHCGSPMAYDVGYDEFDPYTEPRRVLTCVTCP